jgi:hypothetical protein
MYVRVQMLHATNRANSLRSSKTLLTKSSALYLSQS